MSDILDILRLLPYHPMPQMFESISSFLIRASNGNPFGNLERFLNHIFQTDKTLKNWFYRPIQMDFMSPYSMNPLLEATGCPEKQILSTTFSHLLDNFLGRHDYLYGRNWLTESLAENFQFCPLCIKQYGYYFLTWRFRYHPGCPEHGLALVDTCTQCDTKLSLPLTYKQHRMGHCPVCDADLSQSKAKSLNSREYEEAQEFQHKMEFLLSPHEKRILAPIDLGVRSLYYIISPLELLLNWDTELAEGFAFSKFKKCYENRWRYIKSNHLQEHHRFLGSEHDIALLFSFYWMSSTYKEAMLWYLKYRDDPARQLYDFSHEYPHPLGNELYCQMVFTTKVNRNLPSLFNLLPHDFSPAKKYEDLLIRIGELMSKLRSDMSRRPYAYSKSFEELMPRFSNWEGHRQVGKKRDSK